MRRVLPTSPAQPAFERPDRIGAGGSPADRADPDEPRIPSEPEWDASLPSALDSFFAEGADGSLPASGIPDESPPSPLSSPPVEATPSAAEEPPRGVAGAFDQPPAEPRGSATDAFSQRFPGWDDQPSGAVAGDLFAAPPDESRLRKFLDGAKVIGGAAVANAMVAGRAITARLTRPTPRPAVNPRSGRTVADPRVPAAARSRSLVVAMATVLVVALAVVAWRAWTSAPGAPSGTLTVTSRPAGAVLLIDGREQGTTPATMGIGAGAHVLEIRSGGPTQIVSLNVADGGQISRYFDLPAGTAAARLQVNTTPPGAVVAIDGRRRGKSPLVVSDLNPGPHRVRAAIDGQSLERTVMMESGANGAVRLAFDNPNATPPPGHGFLAVTAPIELRGFENGKPVGMTRAVPWLLSAGHHELDFVNDLLGVRERRPVDIREGRIQGLEIAVAPAVLSVTTSVAAEIAIDGAALGTAPVLRHAVPAGQHDVIVRHPVLGERRLLVTVLPGGSVDVHVDLNKH